MSTNENRNSIETKEELAVFRITEIFEKDGWRVIRGIVEKGRIKLNTRLTKANYKEGMYLSVRFIDENEKKCVEAETGATIDLYLGFFNPYERRISGSRGKFGVIFFLLYLAFEAAEPDYELLTVGEILTEIEKNKQ